jgi:hypothetical protein
MDSNDELTKPLVDAWLGVIEECVRARDPYRRVAQLCHQFYAGETGFMWNSDFRRKYFPQINTTPKFSVTINKAFELVAIFGPYLYWNYPRRYVLHHDPLPVYPELFGDPADPIVGQMAEMMSQRQASEAREWEMRNAAMAQQLNYSQREQYGGGLVAHSQLAVNDALVRGRGCLWTEGYKFPGSDTQLIGSFYAPTDDLLIDPDCMDPTLSDARFVVRCHFTDSWTLEQRFGLPEGTLRGKGTTETGLSAGSRQSSRAVDRKGRQKDLIRWYEIYSNCGVGSRLSKKPLALDLPFDRVVGDHVYLCVAKNVDFLLNAPNGVLRNAYDDEVKKLLDWSVPLWKDRRWPVNVLDFYRNGQSCWPLPPLAAGLGELICINVLTSVLISHTFENSRQVIGIVQSAVQEFEKAFDGTQNPAIVKLNDTIHQSVTECVQFLQRPEINGDVWKTIEYLSMLFDKRTGLSELLYSMNPGGTQSRSAEDAKIKQSNASVRPEYMAQQVAAWQTGVAENEKLASYWLLKAKDVQQQLGTVGAMIWEKYVESADPEHVFREMYCHIEANDLKKPNKERQASAMQQMAGYVLPELSKHADMTGDTGPVNAFMRYAADALEEDFTDFEMGDRVPMPPDPEMMQLQQQQMQLEGAKLQADAEKAQADAEATRMEAENSEQQMAMDLAAKQADLQLDAAKAEQQMQLEREKAQQQIQLEQAKAASTLQVEQHKAALQMDIQAQQARQQQKQQSVQFVQGLTQARMEHAGKMKQQRETAAVAKKKQKATKK